MEGLTYAVIGTGGLGGYYGGRLAAAGHDVHFLARSDYGVLRSAGLKVRSCDGDFTIDKVNVYSSSEEMPKADVVLVCMKTTGNAGLAMLIEPILKERTAVVLIQNGLGMEQDLAAELPDARIIGATAFICSTRTAPGTIMHAAYGSLTLAPLDGSSDGLMQQICSDMVASGVPCTITDDIVTMRWKKLVWNIPYNGMSVAENAKTDVLTFDPDLRRQIVALMEEVVAAGRACGADLDEGCIESMVAMTEKMAPYYPSMYIDHAAGRRMEIEFMYDRPIEEAMAHGVDMILTRELAERLRRGAC